MQERRGGFSKGHHDKLFTREADSSACMCVRCAVSAVGEGGGGGGAESARGGGRHGRHSGHLPEGGQGLPGLQLRPQGPQVSGLRHGGLHHSTGVRVFVCVGGGA